MQNKSLSESGIDEKSELMKLFYIIMDDVQEEISVVESNVLRSLVRWLHPTHRLQNNCGSIKASPSSEITWHSTASEYVVVFTVTFW